MISSAPASAFTSAFIPPSETSPLIRLSFRLRRQVSPHFRNGYSLIKTDNIVATVAATSEPPVCNTLALISFMILLFYPIAFCSQRKGRKRGARGKKKYQLTVAPSKALHIAIYHYASQWLVKLIDSADVCGHCFEYLFGTIISKDPRSLSHFIEISNQPTASAPSNPLNASESNVLTIPTCTELAIAMPKISPRGIMTKNPLVADAMSLLWPLFVFPPSVESFALSREDVKAMNVPVWPTPSASYSLKYRSPS